MDDDHLAEQKQQLRRIILAKRDLLSIDERAERSRQAADLLVAHLSSLDLKSQFSIGLFWPIRSEIDCLSCVPILRELGHALALPVVTGEGEMEFRLWQQGDELEPAGYGSMGPAKEAPAVVPDCLIMPLSLFDRDRRRAGYGGGFYDRYIAAAEQEGRRPILIGLAYTLQEVDRVPVGRYDQALDWIVSDQAVI